MSKNYCNNNNNLNFNHNGNDAADRRETLVIKKHFSDEMKRRYYEIPFAVGENVERIDFRVFYDRFETSEIDGFQFRYEKNTLDFSINDADGNHIGSAAAVRQEIFISGTLSSDGFVAAPIKPGEWKMVAGTYLIAPGGVDVEYEITFTYKTRRVFSGDMHMHSLSSDGKLRRDTVVNFAKDIGLDYVIFAEHHNYADNFYPCHDGGITVIPGMEWTTYIGHSNMLGVKQPASGFYCANTHEETLEKLSEGKQNGALVILNHPFSGDCQWSWIFNEDCYDCVEVWNGPMDGSNLKSLSWWHSALCEGRKIPVVGGSDFHCVEPGRSIGDPCTRIIAMSRESDDLLSAVRSGHAYIVCSYKDAFATALCGDKTFGDTVKSGSEIVFSFDGLKSGDEVVFITDKAEEIIACPRFHGKAHFEVTRSYGDALFVRVEVRREYLERDKKSVSLLTNPIYFE